MRKEVLQATIREIAKTACCAWEDYAKRNRGVDGPGLFAGLAKESWARVVKGVNEGDLEAARISLQSIAARERVEKQAWHAVRAGDAIAEYEREADPC